MINLHTVALSYNLPLSYIQILTKKYKNYQTIFGGYLFLAKIQNCLAYELLITNKIKNNLIGFKLLFYW